MPALHPRKTIIASYACRYYDNYYPLALLTQYLIPTSSGLLPLALQRHIVYERRQDRVELREAAADGAHPVYSCQPGRVQDCGEGELLQHPVYVFIFMKRAHRVYFRYR